MSDVLKLTDQDHDLAVQVTTVDDDPTPQVTFMNTRTGQQVSMTIDVFDLVVRAIYRTMETLDMAGGEIGADDSEPELPFAKLN